MVYSSAPAETNRARAATEAKSGHFSLRFLLSGFMPPLQKHSGPPAAARQRDHTQEDQQVSPLVVAGAGGRFRGDDVDGGPAALKNSHIPSLVQGDPADGSCVMGGNRVAFFSRSPSVYRTPSCWKSVPLLRTF